MKRENIMDGEYLLLEEAAIFVRRSKGNIYNLHSQGKIAAFKPSGGRLLFKKSDLINWIEGARISTNAEIEAQAAARS